MLASLLLCGIAAHASAVPVEPPPTLAAVEVAGVMPGPGLWQVRRNGHVIWLIGSGARCPGACSGAQRNSTRAQRAAA
jgi:hypothetical protein